MRHRCGRWALGLLVALVGPGLPGPNLASAQTQTAAVFPAVAGHREIGAEVREEARRAAAEFLRVEDLVVLDDTRVEGTLTPAQRACADFERCGGEVRAALGVDLLVVLVVWGSSSDPSRPDSVHAIIQDAQARYTGTATAPQGVATAVRDALRSALRDQRRGPGPFLRVEGTRGAICELDDRAIGAIPLTVRVAPGDHVLRVRLEGYEPQTLTVTIGGDDPSRTTELEVQLRPSGGGGGPRTAQPDVVANLLIAGGLAVAGLVALAVHPIPTLARLDECEQLDPSGLCAESVAFDAGAGVMLGVGAVLVIAGVVVAIAQPLTMTVSASPQHVSFQLRGEL